MKTVTKEAIIPDYFHTYNIEAVIEQCNYPYDLGIKFYLFSSDLYEESASKKFDSHTVAIFRVKYKRPLIVDGKGELKEISI